MVIKAFEDSPQPSDTITASEQNLVLRCLHGKMPVSILAKKPKLMAEYEMLLESKKLADHMASSEDARATDLEAGGLNKGQTNRTIREEKEAMEAKTTEKAEKKSFFKKKAAKK